MSDEQGSNLGEREVRLALLAAARAGITRTGFAAASGLSIEEIVRLEDEAGVRLREPVRRRLCR